mmetsp:Transcript_8969/g.17311  ORF Transcript_8969/g.17311 Transcript_8969/m.17311 type:complete len:312 (+) Transcript_8969:242-1177(+)
MPANVKSILIGQGISILNASSGVFASLLILLGLELSLFELLVFYALLSMIYTPILIYKKLKISLGDLWRMLLASITDSQGNFFTVLAYRYTSITSVFILSNSSVPIVFVLSYIFLKKKFHKYEVIGVCIALAGILCVILSDLKVEGWVWTGYFAGDVMVLIGTTLYCITNVWQEYQMKAGLHPFKWLSLIGSFAAVIMLIESMSLELSDIKRLVLPEEFGCIFGFAGCLLSLYSIAPYYFEAYGATVYNLSMLTTSLYALIFQVLFIGVYSTDWLYFVGIGFVIIGIVVYNLPPPPVKSEEQYMLVVNKEV